MSLLKFQSNAWGQVEGSSRASCHLKKSRVCPLDKAPMLGLDWFSHQANQWFLTQKKETKKRSQWPDFLRISACTPDVLPSAIGRGKSDKVSWQQFVTHPKYKPWLAHQHRLQSRPQKQEGSLRPHQVIFQCKLDLPIELGHNIRLFKAIKSR